MCSFLLMRQNCIQLYKESIYTFGLIENLLLNFLSTDWYEIGVSYIYILLLQDSWLCLYCTYFLKNGEEIYNVDCRV